MEATLQNGPLIGFVLCFIAGISITLKNIFKMPDSTDLHKDDMWLIFGKLAANKTLFFWGIMPGGIACFGVPLKVGFYDGIWAGIVVFFIYNFALFLIAKVINNIGIQPVFFVLSLITGPIGLVLIGFNIRLI